MKGPLLALTATCVMRNSAAFSLPTTFSVLNDRLSQDNQKNARSHHEPMSFSRSACGIRLHTHRSIQRKNAKQMILSSGPLLEETDDTNGLQTFFFPASDEDSDVFENGDCGDLCLLVDEDDNLPISGDAEVKITELVNYIIKYVPIVAPLLAYMTYENIANLYDKSVELVSNNNWISVDGKAFQTSIITPAINGIVVPAISILFATLVSNTVSTLRQRQLDIRTCLNMEASEIRLIQSMVDAFPEQENLINDNQDKSRSLLTQYTTRLIAESRPGVTISTLETSGAMESEMNGFLNHLNEMTNHKHHQGNPVILSQCYGAVTRLNSHRATRISALLSTFPALHFIILTTLGASICVVFLIETNQEILIFLNSIQLRLLWTVLIGTFSAIGVVLFDLSDPFRGSYEISKSVDQLYTVRKSLIASCKTKADRKAEDKKKQHTSDAIIQGKETPYEYF